MSRKIGLAAIAFIGLMGLAAVPAVAGDTRSCPPGTVRVVIDKFCFGGLFSPETCQDIAICKRLLLHVPHRPVRALIPPPSRPFNGAVLHGHPRLKFR